MLTQIVGNIEFTVTLFISEVRQSNYSRSNNTAFFNNCLLFANYFSLSICFFWEIRWMQLNLKKRRKEDKPYLEITHNVGKTFLHVLKSRMGPLVIMWKWTIIININRQMKIEVEYISEHFTCWALRCIPFARHLNKIKLYMVYKDISLDMIQYS